MSKIVALKLDVDQFPELEPDPYHPQNTEYVQSLEQAKRVALAHQRDMTPRNVHIAKMHFAGQTAVTIADKLDIGPATVGRVIKDNQTQRLIQLLHYIQDAIDGPSVAQRKWWLNKIATDNIDDKPHLATAAIAELNKMGMNQHMVETGASVGNTVNITINQAHFPRTELDG